MHKCVRCERAATTIEEINSGCPCGSKVFVYLREGAEAVDPLSVEQPKIKPAQAKQNGEAAAKNPPQASPQLAEQPPISNEGNGKAPSSYFARMTFTTEDVENIKIVSEGVFAVDVNALSKNPVVLKDEEGIYYVRLPFEQKVKAIPNNEKR